MVLNLRAPSDDDFRRWLRDGTLRPEQAGVLRADLAAPAPLSDEGPSQPVLSKEGRSRGIDPLTVAYYAGALLILGGLGWFLGDQWNRLGPSGIFFVSLSYAALFAFLGASLRFKHGYPNAGGLLITCAVWMVPLMVYALEAWSGLWPGSRPGSFSGYYHWVNSSWVIVEVATAVAGVLVLRFVAFPFLVCPVAVSLWFLSIDVSEWIVRGSLPFHDRAWLSVGMGVLMLVASFMADRRFDVDLAFWGYLFGLAAFWGGLTSMDSGSEFGKAGYALVNAVLVFLSVYLTRRIFLVFGSIGLLFYLYHLADDIFSRTPLFPFVVAFLGLALILGAVHLQRHSGRLSVALDRFRPARFRLSRG